MKEYNKREIVARVCGTSAAAKRKPEKKSGSNGIRTYYHCDTRAGHKTSYHENNTGV